jgi:hypothetical protein
MQAASALSLVKNYLQFALSSRNGKSSSTTGFSCSSLGIAVVVVKMHGNSRELHSELLPSFVLIHDRELKQMFRPTKKPPERV